MDGIHKYTKYGRNLICSPACKVVSGLEDGDMAGLVIHSRERSADRSDVVRIHNETFRKLRWAFVPLASEQTLFATLQM